MPRKDFKYISLLTLVALTLFTNGSAQTYWQQEVEYTMAVNMDIDDYTYEGVQKLVYTNHSPDSLKKVFYHLY